VIFHVSETADVSLVATEVRACSASSNPPEIAYGRTKSFKCGIYEEGGEEGEYQRRYKFFSDTIISFSAKYSSAVAFQSTENRVSLL
jgi:hypothetical protein